MESEIQVEDLDFEPILKTLNKGVAGQQCSIITFLVDTEVKPHFQLSRVRNSVLEFGRKASHWPGSSTTLFHNKGK